MATNENWAEIIRTNYTELLKNIDTENGLFGCIQKEKIFTPMALKSFWDNKDTTERTDKILRCLQKKDFVSFKKFCTALVTSEQTHIVQEYLSNVRDVKDTPSTVPDGVDCAENRGISRGRSECLKQNWNELVGEINFDNGLFAQIEAFKICTPIQSNTLRDIPEETRRTENFLRLLERGSEKQFNDFCSALKNNNQPHIVNDYLTPRGVPPSTPCKNERPKEEPKNEVIVMKEEPKDEESESESDDSENSGSETSSGTILKEDIFIEETFHFSHCSEQFRDSIREKVKQQIAYKCDSIPRGRAVIINNQYFQSDSLPYREGAAEDSKTLKSLFSQLGFATDVYHNKTAVEIINILTNESKDDFHKHCDMFALFLLSHGSKGKIYGLDCETVKTKKIMKLFDGKKCPNLAGKPKLIFIQACQGESRTTGVSESRTVTDAAQDVVPSFQSDAIPEIKVHERAVKVHERADMALFCATVGGYAAWRETKTGSLFVRYLKEALVQNAHEKDLMSIATEVFGALHNRDIPDGQRCLKQMAEKSDTLRKLVYLYPHISTA